MGEDGLEERIRRTLDSTNNDDLCYHLRSALQHLEIDRRPPENDGRR